MGQASASANTGINAAGGSVNNNKPNEWLYAVLALGLVLAAVVFIKHRK